MKRDKIVVIEDEASILEVIDYNLTREGFEVIPCKDGIEGLRAVQTQKPSLVLLDLTLPDLDGVEVCRILRCDPTVRHIPIIVVTANRGESDVLLGLGVGADDCVRKPFKPNELIARVKATLGRTRMREREGEGDRIARGRLVIDVKRHAVTVGEKPVPVTPTEFRLLKVLASHQGRVYYRDQLLDRVVGEDAVVTDRNIDVHVRSIRKKLGPYSRLIETIRGVGYRFKDEEE